jgi:hypothetical protein
MIGSDDIRALVLLRAIRDLSLVLYPFPAGSDISAEKAFALGEIAGTASKAVMQHERREQDEQDKEI